MNSGGGRKEDPPRQRVGGYPGQGHGHGGGAGHGRSGRAVCLPLGRGVRWSSPRPLRSNTWAWSAGQRGGDAVVGGGGGFITASTGGLGSPPGEGGSLLFDV